MMVLCTDPRQAIEHAESGGMALHVWKPSRSHGVSIFPGHEIPTVFKIHDKWGHLLCRDTDRLIATAKRLGIRMVVISKRGKRGQHVDLCGKPLEKAIVEAKKSEQTSLW